MTAGCRSQGWKQGKTQLFRAADWLHTGQMASIGRQNDATGGIAHEEVKDGQVMGGAGMVRFIESRLCGLEFGPTRRMLI